MQPIRLYSPPTGNIVRSPAPQMTEPVICAAHDYSPPKHMTSEKTPLLSKSTRSQLCPLLSTPFASCFPRLRLLSLRDIDLWDESEDEESDDESYLTLKMPQDSLSRVNDKSSAQKLTQLRSLMKKHGIGVYLVPLEDEHLCEYTGLGERRREYISGFTGSAGIAIITLDDDDSLTGKAVVSTDGRYWLQAEKELDPKYWGILKQGQAGVPLWTHWAVTHAINSAWVPVISCDPKVLTLSSGEFLEKTLRIMPFKFEPLGDNLIDEIWPDKPERSKTPVFVYDIQYAGETVVDKLARVRVCMLGALHLVILDLDEIAWLFNLRGVDDVVYNVSFFAYAIVTNDDAVLYIDQAKISDTVRAHLDKTPNVVVKEYTQFYPDLGHLRSSLSNPDTEIILPAKTLCNYALVQTLPTLYARQSIRFQLIILLLKMVKNETELLNTRFAQLKDSLVFIIHAAWIERQLYKRRPLTEWQVAQKIYQIRLSMPNFRGLSYATIALNNANAAIIHYAPTPEKSDIVDPKGIFLLDLGAHYLEGTTDITRTYCFNRHPSSQYRTYYTLVLQGHLSVANAKFPPNSRETGTILDGYARKFLWEHGLDFNHGVGHGVGACGNVHEGPLGISLTAGGPLEEPLFKPGGVLTDEPGYYIDGEVGFRVESGLEIIECDSKFGKTRKGENYLGFGYLTKVPFCRRLIDKLMLSKSEVDWINRYHADIWHQFAPKLKKMGEKGALHWLRHETRPL